MSEAEEISAIADLILAIESKEGIDPSSYDDSSYAAGKYMPEKLLDYKIGEDGKKQFLVKWYGYPPEENTWESEDNLSCNYMMQEIVEKKQRMFENGMGEYFPHGNLLDPSKYVTGELTGLDLGHLPELILGASVENGEINFLVKWMGVFEADLIPRHIANVMCTQQVIEFYEERLQWPTAEETEQILAEAEGRAVSEEDIDMKDSSDDNVFVEEKKYTDVKACVDVKGVSYLRMLLEDKKHINIHDNIYAKVAKAPKDVYEFNVLDEELN